MQLRMECFQPGGRKPRPSRKAKVAAWSLPQTHELQQPRDFPWGHGTRPPIQGCPALGFSRGPGHISFAYPFG